MKRITAMMAFLVFACGTAQAQSSNVRPVSGDEIIEFYESKAKSDRDIRLALATIRSKVDLESYMTSFKGHSPLDRLSPSAKSRFVRGLSFNEKGLSGFKYDDLEAELSPAEIFRVLSLFGVEHLTSKLDKSRIKNPTDAQVMGARPGDDYFVEDHKGYQCVSRANCASYPGYICMSSC